MSGKKFSLTVVGVVAAVILLLEIPILFFEPFYMDGEYPYWKQQKDAVLRNGTQQEVLLLGDSRMKIGARADLLGNDVYNLALGGGTPMEMYYTLKDYLDHHPTPRMVIVAFGPTHYAEAECYMTRNAYFHYFSNNRLRETNEKILEQDGKDYRSESVPYMYRLPNIYVKRIVKALRAPRTKVNRDLYEKAEKSRGRMFGSDRQDLKNVEPGETKNAHFVPLASQTYYMKQLIELCLAHDIPIHITQSPMGNYGLQKLEASGYLAEYKVYMQRFADEYHIDVNPVIPGYDDEYFGDPSHLNEQGQIRFTEELRKTYLE